MRRSGNRMVGVCLSLTLASLMASAVPARAAQTPPKAQGTGPAYQQVGRLAVMHAGRVKPLDTVAREEVKHVFGRETIKLLDASNEVAETWAPVAAFLDWMVRPEVWDDRPFILVDYLPLRQAVLSGTIRQQLKEIAAKPTTSAEDRAALTKLAEPETPDHAAMVAFLKTAKLPDSDRQTVAELASKLTRGPQSG